MKLHPERARVQQQIKELIERRNDTLEKLLTRLASLECRVDTLRADVNWIGGGVRAVGRHAHTGDGRILFDELPGGEPWRSPDSSGDGEAGRQP